LKSDNSSSENTGPSRPITAQVRQSQGQGDRKIGDAGWKVSNAGHDNPIIAIICLPSPARARPA